MALYHETEETELNHLNPQPTMPPDEHHQYGQADMPPDERRKYAQADDQAGDYVGFGATHVKSISGDSDHSTQVDKDNMRRRRSHIHWRYPILTLLLFVAGIALAVGHDVYYCRLDGHRADDDDATSASNTTATTTTTSTASAGFFTSLVGSNVSQQTWAIRIGTGLAFLSKTALSIVVGLVGAQQIWFTLRRKSTSVSVIDGMFQLMENPLVLLLQGGILWHAKLLSVLAVVSWLLPLASIVTPSTLSVQSRMQAKTVEMQVPGFNFSDYSTWATGLAVGEITSTSFEIATLFSNLYSSAKIVPMASAPFPNASYDRTLYGPSYKCISFNEALAANITPAWLVDNPAGENVTTYATFEDAFYAELQVPRAHDTSHREIGRANIFSGAAPDYMFNTILISASGTNALWDAQGKNNNTYLNTTETDRGPSTYYSGPAGTNLVCQLYNTSFDITIQFQDSEQSIIEREVKLLEPQLWNGEAGKEAVIGPCWGVNASMPRLVASDPWSYSSRGNCNQSTATYYVMHRLFSYLLGTHLVFEGTSIFVNMSRTAMTSLLLSPFIHCPEIYNSTQFNTSELSYANERIIPSRCRNGTLAAAIEDMSRNFTYSLLAFSGWSNYSALDTAHVTYTEPHLYFTYARGTLWAVYGAAIGATLLTLLVGARALWHNGVVSSTSFSAILLTTQNPRLHDTLIQGAGAAAEPDRDNTAYMRSVGAQPIDKDVGKLRLRFGYLDSDAGHLQAGFGVEGTVRPFR